MKGQKTAPTPEQRERFVLALISLFDRIGQGAVQTSGLSAKIERINKALRLTGNVNITELAHQSDHGVLQKEAAYEEALRRFEKGEGQN